MSHFIAVACVGRLFVVCYGLAALCSADVTSEALFFLSIYFTTAHI